MVPARATNRPWGTVVTVGSGGDAGSEAPADVRLLAPDAAAEEIVGGIARLRGAKLLHGARGIQPADVTTLADGVA
jgi:hypothetical protein